MHGEGCTLRLSPSTLGHLYLLSGLCLIFVSTCSHHCIHHKMEANLERCFAGAPDQQIAAREVHQMISEQFPSKRGARPALHNTISPLMLHKTLQEQGIVTLRRCPAHSDTSVSTEVSPSRRWGLWVFASSSGLETLTVLSSEPSASVLASLRSLTFGAEFNQNLEGVTLPISLQSLSFGRVFNRSLERVALPGNLHNLAFGWNFDQSLEGVTLPSSLQSLTFGGNSIKALNRSACKPICKAWYMVEDSAFNQSIAANISLQQVTLPTNLQSLTINGVFDPSFSTGLQEVTLPGSQETLTLDGMFNQWSFQKIRKVWLLMHVWAFNKCYYRLRKASLFIECSAKTLNKRTLESLAQGGTKGGDVRREIWAFSEWLCRLTKFEFPALFPGSWTSDLCWAALKMWPCQATFRVWLLAFQPQPWSSSDARQFAKVEIWALLQPKRWTIDLPKLCCKAWLSVIILIGVLNE